MWRFKFKNVLTFKNTSLWFFFIIQVMSNLIVFYEISWFIYSHILSFIQVDLSISDLSLEIIVWSFVDTWYIKFLVPFIDPAQLTFEIGHFFTIIFDIYLLFYRAYFECFNDLINPKLLAFINNFIQIYLNANWSIPLSFQIVEKSNWSNLGHYL